MGVFFGAASPDAHRISRGRVHVSHSWWILLPRFRSSQRSPFTMIFPFKYSVSVGFIFDACYLVFRRWFHFCNICSFDIYQFLAYVCFPRNGFSRKDLCARRDFGGKHSETAPLRSWWGSWDRWMVELSVTAAETSADKEGCSKVGWPRELSPELVKRQGHLYPRAQSLDMLNSITLGRLHLLGKGQGDSRIDIYQLAASLLAPSLWRSGWHVTTTIVLFYQSN